MFLEPKFQNFPQDSLHYGEKIAFQLPPLPLGSDEPTERQTSRPRREGPGGSEGWGEGRSRKRRVNPSRERKRPDSPSVERKRHDPSEPQARGQHGATLHG